MRQGSGLAGGCGPVPWGCPKDLYETRVRALLRLPSGVSRGALKQRYAALEMLGLACRELGPPESSIGCVCPSVGPAEILFLTRNNLRPGWTRRPLTWLQDPGKGTWGWQ